MSEAIGIWLDSDLCSGCGSCRNIAPDLFEQDQHGLSRPIMAGRITLGSDVVIVPNDLSESAISAAEQCPGEIIFLYDIK